MLGIQMRIYTVATHQGKDRVSYESDAKSYTEARSSHSQLLELRAKLDGADRSSNTTKVVYSYQIDPVDVPLRLGTHFISLYSITPLAGKTYFFLEKFRNARDTIIVE